MSREIKFRAFIKHLQIMVKIESIDFIGKMVEVDLTGGEGDTSWYTFENVELVQYTGLKDKNGKEIYEGDILTADSYPYQDEGEYNYHLIVEYIEYGFCGVMHCVGKGRRGISHGIAENLELADEYEVIGNIYENPELLEATA